MLSARALPLFWLPTRGRPPLPPTPPQRHLERVWDVVRRAINASAAADPRDPATTDPRIRRCLAQVEGACWARPGGRCGIYGA